MLDNLEEYICYLIVAPIASMIGICSNIYLLSFSGYLEEIYPTGMGRALSKYSRFGSRLILLPVALALQPGKIQEFYTYLQPFTWPFFTHTSYLKVWPDIQVSNKQDWTVYTTLYDEDWFHQKDKKGSIRKIMRGNDFIISGNRASNYVQLNSEKNNMKSLKKRISELLELKNKQVGGQFNGNNEKRNIFNGKRAKESNAVDNSSDELMVSSTIFYLKPAATKSYLTSISPYKDSTAITPQTLYFRRATWHKDFVKSYVLENLAALLAYAITTMSTTLNLAYILKRNKSIMVSDQYSASRPTMQKQQECGGIRAWVKRKRRPKLEETISSFDVLRTLGLGTNFDLIRENSADNEYNNGMALRGFNALISWMNKICGSG
ncbi:unnamed protein product [Gordionus sp. m RMFG-2023]